MRLDHAEAVEEDASAEAELIERETEFHLLSGAERTIARIAPLDRAVGKTLSGQGDPPLEIALQRIGQSLRIAVEIPGDYGSSNRVTRREEGTELLFGALKLPRRHEHVRVRPIVRRKATAVVLVRRDVEAAKCLSHSR